MLQRCHGPELEGMEDESPHGKKDCWLRESGNNAYLETLCRCDCLLARSLRYIEIPVSGTESQDWRKEGVGRGSSNCVCCDPRECFQQTPRSSFLRSFICSFTKGRQSEELQSTPLHVGFSPRVKPHLSQYFLLILLSLENIPFHGELNIVL